LAETTTDVVPGRIIERRVVEMAQRGDEDARADLARCCQRHAYLFALHLTGNPDTALDVAQDAMLRFFNSLGRFDVERPVRPWLLRIVRNLVGDLRRRARVRRTEPLQRDPDAVILDPPDPRPGPEAWSERRELQRLVWLELQKLPRRYREAVVLRDYQDLPYAEIAEVLQIPRGTLMSRLHRGRAMLRRAVLEQMGKAGITGREEHHG
jgi:RNA polymerase sigma-70 factor (ECF subfamily)